MASIQQMMMAAAPVSGYVSSDPDVQNYFNQVVARAATLSSNTRSAIETFVLGCKSDSIWSLLLDVGPICGDNSDAAQVKLKSLSLVEYYDSPTAGSWTYSEAVGLNRNGSKYLGTRVLANSLSSGSTGIAVYDRSTVNATSNQMGCVGSTLSERFTIYAPDSDNKVYSDLYNASNELASGSALTGAVGFIHAVRNGSSPNHAIYRNGVSIGSTSTVGGSLPAQEILFMGVNSNGSKNGAGAHNYAFVAITAGMTASEAALLYTRVQALQTALGRQV